MNKNVKKILGISLVGITTLGITLTMPTVFAVDKDKDGTEQNKAYCSKINSQDRYKITVSSAYHYNGDKYDVSVEAGTFEVYVYEIDYEHYYDSNAVTQIGTFNIGGKNGKAKTYSFKRSSTPKTYEMVFNLVDSGNECNVDPGAKPKRVQKGNSMVWELDETTSKYGYVYTEQVEVTSSVSDPQFNNVNYHGICAALRNGNFSSYKSIFQEVGLSATDFDKYRSQALNDFTYCNQSMVTVRYREKEIAQIIKSTIDRLKLGEININGTLEGPDSDSQDYSNLKTSASLQCPAYQNSNGALLPNKSSTTNKFYKKEVTVTPYDIYATTKKSDDDPNDATCTKTCEEKVTVVYGPPVASKAGLCFEYKVKVESKLNCQTEFNAEVPVATDYKVCTPTGACNSNTYWSASGPSEEFDSCVNACDGGNYTQSCIDSCYKKVYGNANNTLLPVNYEDKLYSAENNAYTGTVEKLATNEKMQRYYAILEAKDQIGDGLKYSADELREAIVEASTGRYTVKNETIIWQAGNRYWEKPGRYYTLNITNYTVGRLKTTAGRWNNKLGQGGLSVVVGGDGFLRNNSGSSYCGARCLWHGCTSARENKYYTTGKVEDASNREFLNSDEAVKVYLHELNNYINAAGECKAAATCTSKTSEFTIKVNNKTNSNPDKNNWIEYATTIKEDGNLTATTMNGKAFDDDTTIILDKSGCYSQEKPTGNAKYMTEWSFPGTWVNNKTGKISYEPVSGNAWHVKKNKFCTNLDSKYVNTAWWLQRVLQANTPVSESSKATIEDYNIKATAKDFGYFGWNFDISCFYALYDTADGNNNITDDEKPLTYRLRSIDLKDMFPDNTDEVGITDPTETGRAPGFNWTSKATNVKNSDYEITPGALYSIIQARGNEIYDADKQSAYLDYEFYLTPAELNKIRRYSAQEGSGKYSIYPGKVKVANGIAYYESSLFRGSSSSYKLDASSIKVLGTLGVNNQKSQASNESETFGSGDSYISSLRTSRDEYFKNLLGGNK